ncbi:MAG: hypothetical protein CM15mP79_2310 [Methanobacteriota archaeon]|nr:MAG: hypothetical protein CM15mP79_2310 [Euryarchaeota archaeon]
MGPVFGIKGGRAGGGPAQVLPMEQINLHFTGDLHAVTSAHNLFSLDDRQSHQTATTEGLDATRIGWPAWWTSTTGPAESWLSWWPSQRKRSAGPGSTSRPRGK